MNGILFGRLQVLFGSGLHLIESSSSADFQLLAILKSVFSYAVELFLPHVTPVCHINLQST